MAADLVRRVGGVNIVLAGLAALTIFAACFIGSTPMAPGRVIAALFGGREAGDAVILWQIRLPRALCAFVVGAALGASGAGLQGLLRNPLAEPGVLGVSATASLGATCAVYYGLAAINPWAAPLAAIIGALAATAVIALGAMVTQSVVTLILVGVGLSSFAGALMSLLMNFAPNPFTLSDMLNWMLGSVANRGMNDLMLAAPFILLGVGLLFMARRGLSALSLGEEAAMGLGLDLRRQRIMIVLGAGLASGGAVALAGAIGFVGIIAPHVMRPFVGYDPGRAVLPSALFAGLVLVLADIAVRLLPTASELKLGVAAALIGAPVFVMIALRRRGADG